MDIYNKLTVVTFLIVTLLSACDKAEEASVESANTPDITVSFEDAYSQTRTSLNGVTPEWGTENIIIYDTDGKYACYQRYSGDADTSNFYCYSSQSGFSISKFAAAFSPAGNALSYDPNTKTIVAKIEESRQIDYDDFHLRLFQMQSAMISNSRSFTANGTNKIHFSNALFLLKMPFYTTSGATLLSIEVQSLTSSYKLCGNSSRFTFADNASNKVSVEGSSNLWKRYFPTWTNSYDLAISSDPDNPTTLLIPFAPPPASTSPFIQVTVETWIYSKSHTRKESYTIQLNTTDPKKDNYAAQNEIVSMPLLEVGKIPQYPGSDVPPTVIHGIVWAPENLGTDENHPFGLLYQWGRKYGQGYYNATYSPNEQDPTILFRYNGANGTEDPYSFYYGNSDLYFDWITTSTYGSWSSTKGSFDPCPIGWRVPTGDELDDIWGENLYPPLLTGNNGSHTVAGYYLNGNSSCPEGTEPAVFFPAGGERSWTGRAGGRGSYGHYWSSTVDHTHASIMISLYNYCHHTYDSNSYGKSIRCVAE